jgi:transcriptional regulator with XRE-family HTH domain
VDAAAILRQVREHAGLSLRDLAHRAGTSHSTLAAYESGRVTPTVSTFDRIVRAAGRTVDVDVRPRPYDSTPADRGRELADVLDLAGQFPARHSATLESPAFRGRG